jgi:hypothetical protein
MARRLLPPTRSVSTLCAVVVNAALATLWSLGGLGLGGGGLKRVTGGAELGPPCSQHIRVPLGFYSC